MKLHYNLQEAINYRGKTLDQLGIFDITCHEPSLQDHVVGFRESIQMAETNPWMNAIPLHVEVLAGRTYDLNELRKTTREKWHYQYSGWRAYCHGYLEGRSYTDTDKYSCV